MKLWRWLIPLAAVPVLALLAYGFRVSPRDIPSPLVGRPAPGFALSTLDGAPMTLEGHRGKVLVLNFWASWCPPCVEETPSLSRFAEQYADKGVVVLALSVDRDEKAYRAFGRELTPDYNPAEAGLTFACKLSGGIGFLGREAVEKARAEGPRRRLVSVVLDDPDVMIPIVHVPAA